MWPVTVVTILGYLAASRRGWPAARLRRAAAATLILTGVYAAGDVVRQHAGRAAALAPVRDWAHGWQPHALDVARMFVLVSPVAVPAGLAAGRRAVGLAELRDQRRDRRPDGLRPGHLRHPPVETAGHAPPPAAPPRPGYVPLLTRKGTIPVGGTIRAVGCPWQPVFTLPAAACNRHMVIVGATGSGKTNLMIRLWAGWFTAALDAYFAGKGNRPLLIVLDCKGGQDARQQSRPDPPPALRSRRPPRGHLAG